MELEKEAIENALTNIKSVIDNWKYDPENWPRGGQIGSVTMNLSTLHRQSGLKSNSVPLPASNKQPILYNIMQILNAEILRLYDGVVISLIPESIVAIAIDKDQRYYYRTVTITISLR